MGNELVILYGPTAAGKTDRSISLAKEYGSPIVSCDSRQIYRELKIGTAPPSEEQLASVKHYFIFSHSILDRYTAGKYEIEALALLDELFKSHKKVVMVGGSGLYIEALCNGLDDFPDADIDLRAELMDRLDKEGVESLRMELRSLDPESYDTIDIANGQRVVRALEVCLMTGKKFSSFKSERVKSRSFDVSIVPVLRPREELYERINRRVDVMIEDGLVEEVKGLIKYRSLPALNTVGYKEIFQYLDGAISLDDAVNLIKRNTRRYAKRQMTWGRGKGYF
jgi:tRNA dimethylallyltransferase